MIHFGIILPLYNKAPFVRKAMESVVWQTYGEWELIVMDDCSTDGGEDIVTEFTDSRIRLVRLDKNVGVGAARNKGVSLSTAPYICFLDADDWWEPTFLEEMACLIERHPDVGIYGTSYYIVKNRKKRVAPIGVDDAFTEGEINYCQVYAKTLCMPLTSITVCIPRNVFCTTGGFPTNIKLGEDFLLWIHIALEHKVVFLNQPLANYNQDVDVIYRGTHHLHSPDNNMLWHLSDLEPLEETDFDYKQLVDNLRTYNLQTYLLDNRYRSAALHELDKVDWDRQPVDIRRLYRMPIWLLQIRQSVLRKGSQIKQFIIKLKS